MGLGLGQSVVSSRLMIAGVLASILPDVDVPAFYLGIPYDSPFGHRGYSHALFSGLVMGLLVIPLAPFLKGRSWVAGFFSSHGLEVILSEASYILSVLMLTVAFLVLARRLIARFRASEP